MEMISNDVGQRIETFLLGHQTMFYTEFCPSFRIYKIGEMLEKKS